MRAAVLVVTSWVASVAEAPAAEACSWPQPIYGRRVVPADGATEVPTNARVLVEYDAWGEVPAGLELRAAGGATVAAAVTQTSAEWLVVSVLDPEAELAPLTTYEVLDATLVPCSDEDGACSGAAAVIATFTTGAGTDTQPPTTTVSVTSAYGSEPPESSCDWHGDWVVHEVSQAGLADDGPTAWVRYLYEAGDAVRGPLPLMSPGHPCDAEPYFPSYDVFLDADTFTVRAVDLAGNVEVVAHVLEGESCAEVQAEPPADEAEPAGCGCRSSDPRGAPLLLTLALLLLLRGSTRPRARP